MTTSCLKLSVSATAHGSLRSECHVLIWWYENICKKRIFDVQLLDDCKKHVFDVEHLDNSSNVSSSRSTLPGKFNVVSLYGSSQLESKTINLAMRATTRRKPVTCSDIKLSDVLKIVASERLLLHVLAFFSHLHLPANFPHLLAIRFDSRIIVANAFSWIVCKI